MKKLFLIVLIVALVTACSSIPIKKADPCEGKKGVSGWYCKVKN
jgi:uncharacterized protein YceK